MGTIRPQNVEVGRCQSCLQLFPASKLARFGRKRGSPRFCHTCATAEFEKLKRRLITPDMYVTPDKKKEIIE